MSIRTIVEINHDRTPLGRKNKNEFMDQLCSYLHSGDPEKLPEGVTWLDMHHHTEIRKLKKTTNDERGI